VAAVADDIELTFELLRDHVGRLERASSSRSRTLLWADTAHRVALARDERGQIEVFVVGEELEATTRVVRDSMVHQRWTTHDASAIDATRVVLPAEPYFDGMATLVCAELVRNGIGDDAQRAFAMTEPVLGLALRRAALGSEVLVGLAGEMVLLAALLRAVQPAAVPDVLASWAGSAPSSRDFQLGDVGLEVKTTVSTESTHKVSGVHQVELGSSVGGVPESSLYLLSLGIRWLDADSTDGHTLPDLVDSVVARLSTDKLVDEFLARVRQYGGDSGLGYDHRQDRLLPRFRRPFELRFERLYDMTDDAVRVLRSTHLAGLDHVDASSVSFELRLPRHVRGDTNPVAGLAAITAHLVGAAHLARPVS
jgi:hypothetical protein